MKKWLILPRIIEIIGLIILFLIIWFAFPFIEINNKSIFSSALYRLILMASLLFIWLIKVIFFNLFSYLYVKKIDEQLINAYIKRKDSETSEKGLEDEIKEKIKRITKNIQKDFRATKKSWFFWKRKSLRKLPWFLVIGSYSSGKTSVICNTGLDVSYRIDRDGGDKKHNSGMFITHDAVFIEVERYWGNLEDEGDIKKGTDLILLNLLKELRKYRGRKAVNGILLTVDIADVLEPSGEKVKNNIASAKKQIQIICKNLSKDIPFYFLFTKCDLISGFKEFFANVSEEEKKQAWGFSFPIDCFQFSDVDMIKKAYNDLIGRLNQNLFVTLQAGENLQAREKINLFPAEMKLLQEPIEAYIKEYLADSYICEHIWARGVYFSSCNQDGEGKHYSLMSAVARKFDLNIDPFLDSSYYESDIARAGNSQVYFLENLFKDIILQEIYLERKSRRSKRKQFWINFFFYGIASLAVIMSGIATSVYYITNGYNIEKIWNYLHTYRMQRIELNMDDYRLIDILPMLNMLDQARLIYLYNEKDSIMRLNFYRFNRKLEKGVVEALYRELYKRFLPKIVNCIEKLLSEYQNNPVLLYEALQAYLVFGEYSAKDFDKKAIELVMGEHWKNYHNYAPEEIEKLRYYLDLVLSSPVDPVALDKDLVFQAMECLEKMTIPELVFAILEKQSRQKNVQLNIPEFDITSQVGPSFYKVFSDEIKDDLAQKEGKDSSLIVSGFYTSRGFNDFFSVQAPMIVKQVLDIREMLNFYLYADFVSHNHNIDDASNEYKGKNQAGEEQTKQKKQMEQEKREKREKQERQEKQVLEQVKFIYAKNYLSIWKDLLYGLKVTKFENLDQAISVLDVLEKENAVFSEVIKVTKENTSVDVQAGDINVEKVFEPFNHILDKKKEQKTAIENTNQAISNLKGFLLQLKNNPKPKKAQFEAVKKRFTGELKADPIEKLRTQAEQSPEPLKTWLYDLVDQCWDIILLGAKQYINEVWVSTVLKPYNKNLAEYYPLSSQSKTEIDLKTFSDFFGYSGIVDQFFKEYIEPFVDINHTPWRLYQRYGEHSKVEKTTLPLFAKALHIRELYFTPKSSGVDLSFSIKPVLLDAKAKSVKLDLGRNYIVYKHGPQRDINLSWNQKNTSQPVVITFNDFKDETYTKNISGGEWSIFKLFRQSKLRPSKLPSSGLNSYLFTVGSGPHQAIFEISSQKSIDAFLLKPILNFKLPDRL